tara:strand:+ start:261 stop:488 length:228 start_codon:yes stop_codon:yes gene_type:complete
LINLKFDKILKFLKITKKENGIAKPIKSSPILKLNIYIPKKDLEKIMLNKIRAKIPKLKDFAISLFCNSVNILKV